MALNCSDVLLAESHRFFDAAEAAPAGAPVPWCPDWQVEDLVWHVGAEVHHFWAYVLRTRPEPPKDYVELDRPTERDELLALARQSSVELVEELAKADDDEAAWSWHPQLQTVGFTRRRQAHEMVIHRVDAEHALGARSSVDAELAADGVDEYLDWMLGAKPPWGTWHPGGRYVSFASTDLGVRTVVEIGRLTGTPADGNPVDEVDLAVVDPTVADSITGDVTVSAPAAELYLWLWHRIDADTVSVDGDRSVLAEIQPMLDHRVTND